MNIPDALYGVPRRNLPAPETKYRHPPGCTIAKCSAILMYEQELERHRATEAKLRESAIREHALLLQKEELIQQKDILSKESEHRLLNGLQMIASLLSVQSRAAQNAEVAAQLTIAANRVATLGRVHRHLHTLDHVESVEFRQYLEKLCHDLLDMASGGTPERNLAVEGVELRIPTVTAIPLGFIASELLTNSIKYAKGRITVSLTNTGNGHALSISDDGPGLPNRFDPAASRGLGMKLISAMVRQIGGEFQIDKGKDGHGTCFTVLFA